MSATASFSPSPVSTKIEELSVTGKNDTAVWQEYSRFHDSFVTFLGCEDSRKKRSVSAAACHPCWNPVKLCDTLIL